MHSSRMRTARSLTVSPYLAISYACPPEQPCMPPWEQPCTSPPEQPCMPPQSNHACPLRATMHTPPQEQPHMPPQEQPCTPPVNRMTNRCKNITLPQTSFAGGKNRCQTDFMFLGFPLLSSQIRHWCLQRR